MKKVFITIAVLASFFLMSTTFSPKAYAQNNIVWIDQGSYSLTGRVLDGFCAGEKITLYGDVHYVTNILYKPTGGYHEVSQLNTSGLMGIGESGKQYRYQVADIDVFKSNPLDCRLYFDRVYTLKLISHSNSSNYYMKIRMSGYFNTCEQITTIESSEISEECR